MVAQECCKKLRKLQKLRRLQPLQRQATSATLSNLNHRGIILLNVVIILLTIALIGASLMTFYFAVDIFARAVANGTKAFYLAEAGIAHGVNYLSSAESKLHPATHKIGPLGLGEGEYEVEIDFLHSLITAKGRVKGIEKTLQLQFSSL